MQCGPSLKYESEEKGQTKRVNPMFQYHKFFGKGD